jgi:TolB protein
VNVSVESTGHDLDTDGYTIALDGGETQTIPASGVTTLDHVAAGLHRIIVSGAESNCSFEDSSLAVTVVAGEPASAAIHALCRRRELRNVIVFSSEEFGFGELFSMNPDGSERERITMDQQAYASPAISPDGRHIAFTSGLTGTHELYIMNADGTNTRLLSQRSPHEGGPAWSPDGTTIAFESEFEGPFGAYTRIFLINTDGTGLRQLTRDTADYSSDGSASWSPDGRQLVFDRMGQIYTINADGSGLTAISISSVTPLGEPAWSPDGTRIAFTGGSASSSYDIYVVDVDGSNLQRLTASTAQEGEASWSPDGTQLVFNRVVDGTAQIFRINADGTGEVKLSGSASNEDSPVWGPAA